MATNIPSFLSDVKEIIPFFGNEENGKVERHSSLRDGEGSDGSRITRSGNDDRDNFRNIVEGQKVIREMKMETDAEILRDVDGKMIGLSCVLTDPRLQNLTVEQVREFMLSEAGLQAQFATIKVIKSEQHSITWHQLVDYSVAQRQNVMKMHAEIKTGRKIDLKYDRISVSNYPSYNEPLDDGKGSVLECPVNNGFFSFDLDAGTVIFETRTTVGGDLSEGMVIAAARLALPRFLKNRIANLIANYPPSPSVAEE